MPLDPISFLSYGGSIEKLSKKASKHIKLGNPSEDNLYLWGYHRIAGNWKKLQGPSDEQTLEQHQTYFGRETLADYYRNTPHSGFANDTRPVYSRFKISKKAPKANPGIKETVITIKNPASWF
jgi:hypothetical protein